MGLGGVVGQGLDRTNDLPGDASVWYFGEMGKNSSFAVDAHFSGFIARQLEEGRYGSASDVIQAGLRLLEAEEARLEVLRKALIKGEQSGVSARSVTDIWQAVTRRVSDRQ